MTEQRYLEPGWATRNIVNRAVRRLTRMGVSVMGSRELRVRGRKSGQWRATPVNLLNVDGVDYLVSPVTQWVRNIRAAGTGELRLGRHTTAFRADELADDTKAIVLREYLRRWKWEVGQFFENLDVGATEEQIAAVAPGFRYFASWLLGRDRKGVAQV